MQGGRHRVQLSVHRDLSLNLTQVLKTNAKASREVGEVDENYGERRDVELVIADLDVL